MSYFAEVLSDTRGQLLPDRESKDTKTVPGKGRRIGIAHSPRLSLKAEGAGCKTLSLSSEEDILILFYLIHAV